MAKAIKESSLIISHLSSHLSFTLSDNLGSVKYSVAGGRMGNGGEVCVCIHVGERRREGKGERRRERDISPEANSLIFCGRINSTCLY